MSPRYTLYSCNPEEFLGERFYDWRKHVFVEVAGHLRRLGYEVTLEDRNWFDVSAGSSATERITILDSLAFLQDDDTGEYYTLDCHDMVKLRELELMVDDDRCRRVLKCQYLPELFDQPRYEKVRRWTYFDRFWPKHEDRLRAYRGVARTSGELYFRGADWGKRGRILRELSRRGVIRPDFKIVDYERYISESTEHRFMLSLPGFADICNRDIECFGSGTCVLRPRLRNEAHSKLIADYHYVSVDVRCGSADAVEVAGKIEQRFSEIVNDHAFVDSVIDNAARWYDENVSASSAVQLSTQLLGLEGDSSGAGASQPNAGTARPQDADDSPERLAG